jgi:VWFA-related protein
MKPSAFARISAVLGCATVFLIAPAIAPQAKDSPPFTIQVDTNRVLVPVVVRDKQGRVVSDLKRDDFQVFDDEKPRLVSGFSVEKREAMNSASGSTPEAGAQDGGAARAIPRSSSAPRFIVFLFDDMHLSIEDLAQAKRGSAALLAGALAGSDFAAVVSMSGRVNSGLTRDRAKLQEAIRSLQPRSIMRPEVGDCPKIDYYQADLIENKHDEAALQDVEQQLIICNPPPPGMLENQAELAARRALTVGQQDVQTSFAFLGVVVRGMANLPGQRTLILVSPGFLTITPEALSAESHIIDLAAQANVIMSAMDARGMYVTEVNASDDARGRSPGEMTELRRSSMSNAESVMSELADGTGGTYFHHNNDLNAGFKRLTEAPECVYLLELSLQGVKQNGSYHRLKVKVNRAGAQLQARRGYFVPKPPKGKKQKGAKE